MMLKIILSICLAAATAAFAGTVIAQEAAERDPFFSEGPRSLSTSSSQDNGEWARDPFAKPFEGTMALPEAHAPQRKLTGIIFGKNARIAIISGEMVKEGSVVGDRKLMTIRQHSIVLMNSSGSTEEVFLENFSIRK